MGYMVSASIIAGKWPTLLYSSEMGCRTVPIHGLYPNSHTGLHESHGHCDRHTPMNGIDLPTKQCEEDWKSFWSDWIGEEENLSSNHLYQVASCQPGRRSCASDVIDYTSGWGNYWRDRLTSASPLQDEQATHCTILPWNSAGITITACGDHSGGAKMHWQQKWWMMMNLNKNKGQIDYPISEIPKIRKPPKSENLQNMKVCHMLICLDTNKRKHVVGF